MPDDRQELSGGSPGSDTKVREDQAHIEYLRGVLEKTDELRHAYKVALGEIVSRHAKARASGLVADWLDFEAALKTAKHLTESRTPNLRLDGPGGNDE